MTTHGAGAAPDDYSVSLFVDGRPEPLTPQHYVRFELRGDAVVPVLVHRSMPVQGVVALALRLGKA